MIWVTDILYVSYMEVGFLKSFFFLLENMCCKSTILKVQREKLLITSFVAFKRDLLGCKALLEQVWVGLASKNCCSNICHRTHQDVSTQRAQKRFWNKNRNIFFFLFLSDRNLVPAIIQYGGGARNNKVFVRHSRQRHRRRRRCRRRRRRRHIGRSNEMIQQLPNTNRKLFPRDGSDGPRMGEKKLHFIFPCWPNNCNKRNNESLWCREALLHLGLFE